MFKTNASKILGLIALFLLVIFSWVMINDARKKKAVEQNVNPGIENPFGQDSSEVNLPDVPKNEEDEGTISEEDANYVPKPSTDITIVEENPALRHLTTTPVAGFTFVNEERIIPEEASTTPDQNLVEVYDFSGYKTIKFGDKADEIVKIKTVLNRQTPSPALTVNTEYDTDMKNAVVDFQNKNGLSGDGVIGPKTYMKLNAFQGITAYSSAPKPKNIEVVQMVRYVGATDGIVSDKAVRKMEEAKKLTTTKIPQVREAFFDNTGEKIVMRYLKDEIIQTYLVKLTFPKMPENLTSEEIAAFQKTAAVSGEFLPENIKVASVSKDGKNLFYMNPVAGGSAGITYNFATKAKKQIWDTPLNEWIADWGSEGKINLTTKASGLVKGYSYNLDVKTGSISKNVGAEGLTTLLSPDGKKLLYSEYAKNKISTFMLDLTTGKTTSISPETLPEKCVWTKDSKKVYCGAMTKALNAIYPDDWYKGKISFDDALWVIDAGDLTGNIVYDFLAKSKEKIDVTNLRLNDAENYIGFINKKDGTLWGFDLDR